MKNKGRRNCFHLPFTLIELVVVIAVIVLTLGLVAATFRGESAARQMENLAIGFESFCARARFQAQEHGEDILVCFSPDTKEFITRRTLTDEELAAEERRREEVKEGEEEEKEPPVQLKWKLPEKITVGEDDFAEEDADEEHFFEVFRFFPDGGASSIRKFHVQCKNLSRTYDISPITGLLVTVKEENMP